MKAAWIGALATVAALPAAAQPAPKFSKADAAFVAYDQPVIVFTNVQVVDGTGAPPKRDQKVVVRDGRIAEVGPARRVKTPERAVIIEGAGKTLLPGFVMVHEHMFYPTVRADYADFTYSFSRLYLAGGATTIRTGGSLDPYADLAVARAIAAGTQPGPDMDVTGAYLDGAPRSVPAMPRIEKPEDAERVVNYWAEEGATSFKAYVRTTEAELKAAVVAAHARKLKVTGHLCAVTYAQAAAAGIDNLEHGFSTATDFVPAKEHDGCPAWPVTVKSVGALDPAGPEIGALIDTLIARKVALTSTLAIVETLTAGRPKTTDAALDLLAAPLRAEFEATWPQQQASPFGKTFAEAFPKLILMERRFMRSGGLLLTGSDPTGFGGVLPGFSARRQLQIMVEGGFTFPEAVQAMTLNGARYLGREAEVGSIAAGKRADLVLIDGDPVADPKALDGLSLVFKAGVGYRSAAIIEAMKAGVGLY